jgi:hypothetical protein
MHYSLPRLNVPDRPGAGSMWLAETARLLGELAARAFQAWLEQGAEPEQAPNFHLPSAA